MELQITADNYLIIQDPFNYQSELSTGYAKGSYKYSETLSIIMLTKDDEDTKTYVIEHTNTNQVIKVPLSTDGHYYIEYIIIPTDKWYQKIPDAVKNLYDIVYYSDGETITEVKKGGQPTEVDATVLSQNIIRSTTIGKNSDDFISVANLRKCYINLCYQIFADRGMSSCWNKNKIDSELIYKRDLVWMSLNVISYLTELGEYEEITRILQQINGCNGLCKSDTTATSSNCGCSK